MTNIVLNVLVLVVLAAVSWPVLRRLRAWPLVWASLLLCVLTAVFDTIMIDVGLYVFDPAKILGVHVWGAPLEDFAYAIAAAVLVPVLWTVLGRSPRTSSRPDGHPAAGPDAAPPGAEG